MISFATVNQRLPFHPLAPVKRPSIYFRFSEDSTRLDLSKKLALSCLLVSLGRILCFGEAFLWVFAITGFHKVSFCCKRFHTADLAERLDSISRNLTQVSLSSLFLSVADCGDSSLIALVCVKSLTQFR